jgi:uncharacterized membrane protein YdcZ (DUF606 family)
MESIPDWVWMMGFFAVWFVLMRWVFPRMGVGT